MQKKKNKVSVVDHDWVWIKWSKSHLWLNRAARRLLIFPTLEAEMLGFLYVQRSVCVYNSADASDCYGCSVSFSSLGFGQYQELAMHSGRYLQDSPFQVYAPLPMCLLLGDACVFVHGIDVNASAQTVKMSLVNPDFGWTDFQ